MTITALPAAPTPADSQQTFNSRAFALVAALAQFVTEANDTATTVNADKLAAAASALSAAASAASAAAAAGASRWVSGTTYAQGDVVWSPATYLTYRRKTAGAGTTDPSADGTNWEQCAGTGNVDTTATQTLTSKTVFALPFAVKSAAYAAVAGDRIAANTTGGAFAVTLPASPSAGDYIDLLDYAGTFETNALTLARNGSNIYGAAENLVLDINNFAGRLEYINATQGWRFV